MADLLPGLGKFGLGKLSDLKLFEEPEEEKEEAKNEPVAPVYNEEEFLFDKTYTCPICDHKYGERTVRTGKARLLGIDLDLRPRHEQLDVGKYDVISCPKCGYTVLSRYFAPLSPTMTKLVKENIASSFVSRSEKMAVYTYDTAFERYQLCLANAIVKRGKDSEKAYICLKTGWILRGMGEHLDKAIEKYDERLKEIKQREQEYLRHAYEGFIKARSTEGYPMCGMDETTLDYLLAALAIGFEEFDVATKMIGGILASAAANSRMKDKARELKEVMQARKGS
ncbi:MAG: DUF2225 domain-containing protein [Lachnospiraceae bacterium]|nr:DUF2225 domain-containing protein [Lachnospiraceae bacterium]